MDEVLQANIFFYIASVAVVIFTLIVALVLFQIYKIIKLIRSILERIESASEIVSDDVAAVRRLIASQGLVASIIGFVLKANKKKTKKTSKEV